MAWWLGGAILWVLLILVIGGLGALIFRIKFYDIGETAGGVMGIVALILSCYITWWAYERFDAAPGRAKQELAKSEHEKAKAERIKNDAPKRQKIDDYVATLLHPARVVGGGIRNLLTDHAPARSQVQVNLGPPDVIRPQGPSSGGEVYPFETWVYLTFSADVDSYTEDNNFTFTSTGRRYEETRQKATDKDSTAHISEIRVFKNVKDYCSFYFKDGRLVQVNVPAGCSVEWYSTTCPP